MILTAMTAQCKLIHLYASSENSEMKIRWLYEIGYLRYLIPLLLRWRGGAMARALDLQSTGFKSYSGQSCVTTVGRLFTPMCRPRGGDALRLER